jgi:IS5 family transposase
LRQKIEKGRKVRVDCSVVESNIHHPMDSSQLEDCVRVLARLTGRAKEAFNLDFKFVNHSRRAKKRAYKILNAKNKQQRKKPYQDLLHVTQMTVGYAKEAVQALRERAMVSVEPSFQEMAKNAAERLETYISLAEQVISQTERRVLHGETVPADEKVFSIFEPHTDIIIKDSRDTLFGHKISITGGASGLITDLVIEEGNPADSTLAVGMIERQKDIYGRAPRQAAFDGGFASKANLGAIKDMGVKDVSFHKKRGLKIADMVKSTWVYKRLRNFRAGIEGMISFLKRGFGLNRCTWRGFESFKSYAWASVVTANLLVMARHLLA